jgi:hypothetical protein
MARQAALKGWRTAAVSWRWLLRSTFHLAGMTTTGAVWEIERFWQNSQLLLRWRSYTRALPYGSIELVSKAAANPPDAKGGPLKRIVVRVPDWPSDYQLYVSHDQLAQLVSKLAVMDHLRRLPSPPHSGALVKIVWQRESLTIVCTFSESWPHFENIVGLGNALLETNHS